MKASTIIVVAIGAVLALVAILAIAKALKPRPKSTLETLIGGASPLLSAWLSPSKAISGIL